MKINKLQKLRFVQAFFAFVLTMLSMAILNTFSLPAPPLPEAFLTGTELLRYNLVQLVFLVSFIGVAGLLGMVYQAKDVTQEEN